VIVGWISEVVSCESDRNLMRKERAAMEMRYAKVRTCLELLIIFLFMLQPQIHLLLACIHIYDKKSSIYETLVLKEFVSKAKMILLFSNFIEKNNLLGPIQFKNFSLFF